MEKFEEKYSLKSEDFLKKFDNGRWEMGDDLDFFEWYAFVDSYNRVEKRQRVLMEKASSLAVKSVAVTY